MKRYFTFFTVLLLPFSALIAVPMVTSLNPAVGDTNGATSVTIKGNGFTGATSVLFGNTPATSFTVNSDSSITATSPAHVPQAISVTVTSPSGTSTVSTNSYFTFQGDILAYVLNNNSLNLPDANTVSVINTRTNTVVNTVGLNDNPYGINILPDGSFVYVAEPGQMFADTTVQVISGANGTIADTLSAGVAPLTFGVLPNGQKVYVANANDTTVSAITSANNQISKTIPVGNSPTTVAVTPDGTKVLIANVDDGTVQIIDPTTDVAGSPIASTIILPNGIAITPNNAQAYVASIGLSSTDVVALDLTGVNPPTFIPVGGLPFSIAITPVGNKAYVTIPLASKVSVINTATNTVTGTIPGLPLPLNVIINTKGSLAYIADEVASPGQSFVSVVDTSNDTVIATISGVGSGANAIYITPDNTEVYVACENVNSVSVIDTATNTLKTTIPVGERPIMIVMAPDQAPLAKFTHSSATPGVPVVFDASASTSPTGQIVNYHWDFGDSTTLDTPNPIVTHTYASDPTVTLTVTNSAGTSTTQIFNYSTNTNIPLVSLSMLILNNGGPTATTSQVVTLVNTPSNFKGCRTSDTFINETDYINVLTWDPPSSGVIASYRIYRDANLTQLIAVIPANQPLEFFDHDRKKNQTYTYYIVAVDPSGNTSVAISTTVSPKQKCTQNFCNPS